MFYLLSLVVVGGVFYFVGKLGPEQFVQKIQEKFQEITKSF